jgi:hypothetical protein
VNRPSPVLGRAREDESIGRTCGGLTAGVRDRVRGPVRITSSLAPAACDRYALLPIVLSLSSLPPAQHGLEALTLVARAVPNPLKSSVSPCAARLSIALARALLERELRVVSVAI